MDVLEISRGRIAKAQKVVIYGPEGIGKSTFLSQFPGVIFIDTEGSTCNMDVFRTPPPTSWTMLLQQVTALIEHPPKNGEFKTLAIDTADWAEKLCSADTCARHNVSGIEDFGYGKGYTYNMEAFGKLLNLCTDLTKKGINVVFSAHATMRKFEQPDEMGAYDRWELKCDKRISTMLKEWADAVLFINYKTYVITPDNKMEKKKVTGGKRVMYTTHHACWDAKNRWGLPDELPLSFAEIARFIPGTAEYESTAAPAKETPKVLHYPENCTADEMKAELDRLRRQADPGEQITIASVTESETEPPISTNPEAQEETPLPFYDTDEVPDGIPDALADLMRMDKVTWREVQHAVACVGYYTDDAPFTAYEPDFVQGVLIAAWMQVRSKIIELREKEGEKHEY